MTVRRMWVRGVALKVLLTAALALACLAPAPAGAQQEAGASSWAVSPKSRARLISSGPAQEGVYAAGVEILLQGEALTYWRNPGDAGVPPSFDFAASANLAAAEVTYPAPERHDEGGAQAFGWRKTVVFPITVRPADPARPVTLDLMFRYAACEAICVPSEGRMRLTLSPKDPVHRHAERIAAWRTRAPLPAATVGVGFDVRQISSAAKPAWSVRVAPQPGDGADLFAEGPEGWFFDTKAVDGAFEVHLAEKPANSVGPAAVRLTLTRPAGAVEYETKLDAGGDAH